ncbi:cation:proton antiporter [Streptomyces coacervatus]|uniref:Cation:proton antiporter n=1 Tax=Streptomyces coacervatus TaxID=647381 RepID=A0ABP7GNW5_9ACTN|nr:cation:proton antiporter [Streptomyces coacervatus]MDF2264893.1 cation:proton antiporter [Streptomyces coacervatus]
MSSGAWTVVAVAGVTAAYALGSRRLSTTPVSSAIVFTGCGILIGPAVLDVVDIEHAAAPLTALLEAALTLVLFTDAMTVRRRDLALGGFLPGRLLGIGLPLSIAAGWLLAWPLVPGLTVWELALVGAILAPTDAALGKSAMSDPRVPALVREGLNVESGLNDGMVLPFFVVFLAAIPGTSYAHEGVAGTFWRALLLSSALGLLVGGCGGWLLQVARAHGWVDGEWRQVLVLAVAAASYDLAVLTDGSGFIAAWVAGFAFGYALRRFPATTGSEPAEPESGDRTSEFAENLGSLLASLSLMVFGAVLLGPALQHLTWKIVLYAVLSLTVVRMLPVAVSLTGSGLRLPTVAYVGWFGPRGLASVVLALLVVEEHVPGTEAMGRVVAATVALSILLHGVSAVALAGRYGAWFRRATAAGRELREGTAVPESPAPSAGPGVTR